VLRSIDNQINRQRENSRGSRATSARDRSSVRCTIIVQMCQIFTTFVEAILVNLARILCRLYNRCAVCACYRWIARYSTGGSRPGMCSIVGNRAHASAPTLSGPAVEVDGAAPSPPSNFLYGHLGAIFVFLLYKSIVYAWSDNSGYMVV
jgi:hypothetical protein